MAFVHGKGVVHTIDGKSMTGFTNKITWSREADVHDTTTFGNNAKTYQAGLTDGTASIEGIYDNTAVTGPRAVLEPLVGGASVIVVYRPEGTASGRPTSSVSVLVKSYSQDAAVDDMITWTADLQFTGAITDSAQ